MLLQSSDSIGKSHAGRPGLAESQRFQASEVLGRGSAPLTVSYGSQRRMQSLRWRVSKTDVRAPALCMARVFGRVELGKCRRSVELHIFIDVAQRQAAADAVEGQRGVETAHLGAPPVAVRLPRV